MRPSSLAHSSMTRSRHVIAVSHHHTLLNKNTERFGRSFLSHPSGEAPRSLDKQEKRAGKRESSYASYLMSIIIRYQGAVIAMTPGVRRSRARHIYQFPIIPAERG